MNVNDLIGADPDLLQNLMDLGLSYAQVDDLGLHVSAQLAENASQDLSELLGRLNGQSFLMHLNVRSLADGIGADFPTLQAALLLLASAVTLFEGDVGEMQGLPSTPNDPGKLE